MVSLRLVAKWSRSAPGESVSRQSPSFSLAFLRPSSDRFLLLAHWLLRPVRSHYLTLSYHLPSCRQTTDPTVLLPAEGRVPRPQPTMSRAADQQTLTAKTGQRPGTHPISPPQRAVIRSGHTNPSLSRPTSLSRPPSVTRPRPRLLALVWTVPPWAEYPRQSHTSPPDP
ncbi:hypothetical protein HYQ44_011530 [Verticillium longisporum]|nr:hypothetical protein HYQ44_011530 [Verticillium longisporum]